MIYQPKRSTKRFLENAPHYVLACYDNGGKTCDRYTVIFGWPFWSESMGRNVPYLGMSEAPSHPQGFSQWGEMPAHNRKACGKHIAWNDLPENIRVHVVARAKQGVTSAWDLLILALPKTPDRIGRLARDAGWHRGNFKGVARTPKDDEIAESYDQFPKVHAGSWRAACVRDGLI